MLPSSGTMLTIKPSSPNITCPTEITCLTLSEYAHNHSQYFNHANITLQFLPGNHTLDVSIIITSSQIQYLEINGSTTSPPSTVMCSTSPSVHVGFVFRDIPEVRVSGMTFISCGTANQIQYPSSPLVSYSQSIVFYFTVWFHSVYGQSIEITNCVFRESFGSAVAMTALVIGKNTASVIGNNTFSNNCRRCSVAGDCILIYLYWRWDLC